MRKPVILLIGLIASSCGSLHKYDTKNKVYYLDPDAKELQFGDERLPLNHPQADSFYCATPETWEMVLGQRGVAW